MTAPDESAARTVPAKTRKARKTPTKPKAPKAQKAGKAGKTSKPSEPEKKEKASPEAELKPQAPDASPVPRVGVPGEGPEGFVFPDAPFKQHRSRLAAENSRAAAALEREIARRSVEADAEAEGVVQPEPTAGARGRRTEPLLALFDLPTGDAGGAEADANVDDDPESVAAAPKPGASAAELPVCPKKAAAKAAKRAKNVKKAGDAESAEADEAAKSTGPQQAPKAHKAPQAPKKAPKPSQRGKYSGERAVGLAQALGGAMQAEDEGDERAEQAALQEELHAELQEALQTGLQGEVRDGLPRKAQDGREASASTPEPTEEAQEAEPADGAGAKSAQAASDAVSEALPRVERLPPAPPLEALPELPAPPKAETFLPEEAPPPAFGWDRPFPRGAAPSAGGARSAWEESGGEFESECEEGRLEDPARFDEASRLEAFRPPRLDVDEGLSPAEAAEAIDRAVRLRRREEAAAVFGALRPEAVHSPEKDLGAEARMARLSDTEKEKSSAADPSGLSQADAAAVARIRAARDFWLPPTSPLADEPGAGSSAAMLRGGPAAAAALGLPPETPVPAAVLDEAARAARIAELEAEAAALLRENELDPRLPGRFEALRRLRAEEAERCRERLEANNAFERAAKAAGLAGALGPGSPAAAHLDASGEPDGPATIKPSGRQEAAARARPGLACLTSRLFSALAGPWVRDAAAGLGLAALSAAVSGAMLFAYHRLAAPSTPPLAVADRPFIERQAAMLRLSQALPGAPERPALKALDGEAITRALEALARERGAVILEKSAVLAKPGVAPALPDLTEAALRALGIEPLDERVMERAVKEHWFGDAAPAPRAGERSAAQASRPSAPSSSALPASSTLSSTSSSMSSSPPPQPPAGGFL